MRKSLSVVMVVVMILFSIAGCKKKGGNSNLRRSIRAGSRRGP